jgi:hypothetical protein
MLAQSRRVCFAPDDYRAVTQSFLAALAKKISD